MTLHLKSRGYPFRPRLLFSSFIVVGVGSPTVYYFRRGQKLLFLRWKFNFPTEERFWKVDKTVGSSRLSRV